jgi:hypothetical protein
MSNPKAREIVLPPEKQEGCTRKLQDFTERNCLEGFFLGTTTGKFGQKNFRIQEIDTGAEVIILGIKDLADKMEYVSEGTRIKVRDLWFMV